MPETPTPVTEALRAAPLRSAVAFAVWSLVLFGLWCLLVGEWTASDLVAGVLLAALGAAAGVLVVSYGLVTGREVGRAVRVLPSVALAVVADFGVVATVLARSLLSRRRDEVGAFVSRPAYRRPPDGGDAGRRSWITVAATVSPNAYVIAVDAVTGTVLLHDLRPRRKSERPA